MKPLLFCADFVEDAIRENRVMTESLRFESHVIAEGQALLVSKLEEFISALEGRHTAHEDSLKSLQDRTGRLESRMTRVEQFVRIDS